MEGAAPTVYLVDDDPDLLSAMQRLLESVGMLVATFPSAQVFLQEHDRLAPGCLVLDLAMPGLSGLQLQRELQQRASPLPIVFLTGRGDIAASVQAMKHGATDFLTKPVDDFVLLAAIREALETNRLRRRTQVERERIAQCLAALTERERQVLERVVTGRLNKQIAADLGTVEKTIKFHRGNLMRKMGVRSVAELVKLTELVGISARPAG
ncbi:MAG TPA: response regulator [Xanthomonadales bacterium]|nr:response regulator [Xanthomonadales bacterium]